MKFDPHRHHRKSYRLQTQDYAAPAAYFVTLTTKNRECLFGEVVRNEMVLNALGNLADGFFRDIPQHFPHAEIDVHQVMPNHVHGIIVIHENNRWTTNSSSTVGATQWVAPTKPRGPHRGSIGAILGAYKMSVTRRAKQELNLSDIWQRNYYDHVIRNNQEWQAIRRYILSNPANWTMDEDHPA